MVNELEFRLTSPMSLKKQVPLALFDPDLKAAEPANLVVVELGRRGVYSPGPGVGAKTGFAASCRSFCFFFRDLGVRCIVLALSPADRTLRTRAGPGWIYWAVHSAGKRRAQKSSRRFRDGFRKYKSVLVNCVATCTLYSRATLLSCPHQFISRNGGTIHRDRSPEISVIHT